MLKTSITPADIVSICRDLWSSMVNIPLSPVTALREKCGLHEGIAGHIKISGAWAGGVELRSSRKLACATAACLLNKESARVTVEECFDAMQESTNIVAGNIKR